MQGSIKIGNICEISGQHLETDIFLGQSCQISHFHFPILQPDLNSFHDSAQAGGKGRKQCAKTAYQAFSLWTPNNSEVIILSTFP
ncbi:unnamed protein product, partial [Vitis vinifera]